MYDQLQDRSGQQQYRIAKLYDPPEFVKQASHRDICGDPEDLPSHVYAYPSRKLFPCHTKAATWMSAAFLAEQYDELPKGLAEAIQYNLEKRAAYFGILDDVRNLRGTVKQAAAKITPAQLPDELFALVWDGPHGRERHYPLRNPEEIKTAAAWFHRYRDELPYSDRQAIASRILDRADEEAVSLPEDQETLLTKCAGYGVSSTRDLVYAWDVRARLVKGTHPQHAEYAEKVASLLREASISPRQRDLYLKMADCLDRFDRETRLTEMYEDGGLDRPEEIVFRFTTKEAQAVKESHIRTTTGRIYQREDLEKISSDMVREWFGDDLADEVGGVYVDTEKLADILATLPRPEAQTFDRMAEAAGIRPVAIEKSAASRRKLTPQQLSELAAAYRPRQPAG